MEYATRLRRELRPGGSGSEAYEVAGALVNLTGRRRAATWRAALPKPARAALTWTVELRTMREEDAAALLAEIDGGRFGRCLLPWIPLMKGANEADLVDEWVRIASAEPDSRVRGDYGALALIFAELAKRPIWKQKLKGWNVKESQQVLEWQEEARREGREKGREEKARENLLRALRYRFQGDIPEDLRSRIDGESDLATLDRWFDLAFTAEDLEGLRRGW